jgi:hypothetical protein
MPPDEDQLSLRQADQIRGDLYAIQDDLDFIKVQLARLPTRYEVWRAAILGMIGGAVAAVTLISVAMMPSLMPTMPYSSASATRQMRPMSRL